MAQKPPTSSTPARRSRRAHPVNANSCQNSKRLRKDPKMRCIQTRPSTSRSTTARASKPRKNQTEKRAGTDAPLPRETVSFAHLCRSYADPKGEGHTILRATCVPRARGGALDNRVDRSSSWGGSMCLRGRSISGRPPESTRHLPASSPSMCAFHLSPVLARRSLPLISHHPPFQPLAVSSIPPFPPPTPSSHRPSPIAGARAVP
ncbi:hypothetical protein B0H11DRAFT_2012114 [Mycena galericulata]|nr:hypothetical protein B0H11DRAFT_2012114 [Mycena galericulata]